jgi:hypothetical protein
MKLLRFKFFVFECLGDSCDLPLSASIEGKESSGIGSAGAGMLVALLLAAIIVALLLYYRRRVNRLKCEIANVQYIADPNGGPGKRINKL